MAKGTFTTIGKGKRRFVPHKAPEDEDDEELELEDEDAEEDGAGGSGERSKKKRRRSLVDDAAEEDVRTPHVWFCKASRLVAGIGIFLLKAGSELSISQCKCWHCRTKTRKRKSGHASGTASLMT